MEEKDKYADEMLTDDELDKVAGGTPWETAEASSWLKVLGLLDESYNAGEIFGHSDTSREQKIYDAFQKLGIGFVWHGGYVGNGYYIGQQSLRHEEVFNVARAQAKRLRIGIYSDYNG